MAGVSALERACVLTGRWRGLLPVVAADLRSRYFAIGHQSDHDHTQNTRPRYGVCPYAGLLLDGPGIQSADCRRLPRADGNVRDAAARSLLRFSFLHE